MAILTRGSRPAVLVSALALAALPACSSLHRRPFPDPVREAALMRARPGAVWNAVAVLVDGRGYPLAEVDRMMGTIVTDWVEFSHPQLDTVTVADCGESHGHSVEPNRGRFEFAIGPRASRASLRIRAHWQAAIMSDDPPMTRHVVGYFTCRSTGEWEKLTEVELRRMLGDIR